MEIFTKEYYGYEDENKQFFLEWYEAIIRDFNIFSSIIKKYEYSNVKDILMMKLSYISTNLFKSIQVDDKFILKNTPNYFLFSFYDPINEIPTYVLFSKDYKRFIIASEEMECFDDYEFDEDERYGIYVYDYFFLENNKIKYVQIRSKEYTKDFNGKFDNSMLYCETEESEKYYDWLLSGKKLNKVNKKTSSEG